jgi:hypothetical protein
VVTKLDRLARSLGRQGQRPFAWQAAQTRPPAGSPPGPT